MGMIINASVVAMDVGRTATMTSSELGRALERLSSGARTVRADGPGGNE